MASVLGPASHTSNLFHLPSPGSFGLLRDKNDYTSKASPLGQSIPSSGVLLRCTRSVEGKERPREDRGRPPSFPPNTLVFHSIEAFGKGLGSWIE